MVRDIVTFGRLGHPPTRVGLPVPIFSAPAGIIFPNDGPFPTLSAAVWIAPNRTSAVLLLAAPTHDDVKAVRDNFHQTISSFLGVNSRTLISCTDPLTPALNTGIRKYHHQHSSQFGSKLPHLCWHAHIPTTHRIARTTTWTLQNGI